MIDINRILTRLEDPILDVRYLLDRKYPKKSVITYVSNHYGLTKDDRNILARIACKKDVADDRKRKVVSIESIYNKKLFIDGFNVLITVESLILGYPVFLCDDGILKDVRSLFHRYKMGLMTREALYKIETITSKYNPKEILIIFDSQISKSGELSKLTRDIFNKDNCFVFISKNTDKDIIENSKKEIVATSDGIIIDNVEKVIDIPIYIANEFKYNYYIPTRARYGRYNQSEIGVC
ncbi:MAG: DUF434 domain-containing protein [Candidatus Methanoliparum thermophilum]|uniref:DUF434 domain-containing protein n=1 Tax=Methanoliparum thermophilum TaxID=2491083 RepID=A0A520KSC0_METT2|nr:DUF434 domain-containing protein [Candidatus Methanoliparum sp. LAM-1]RZN64821.1 MAG: DUF434 domain-containing protein [Candidatus Methanoliparum thermophilum]BDC36309.1 hypothetical protein MTLP_09910 [Candidatus Methanoliparum sp. LAM-1]